MKTPTDILEGFLSTELEIFLSKPHLALLLLARHRNLHTERETHDFAENELLDLYQVVDSLERKEPAGTQTRARNAVSALQKARVIIRSDCGGLSAKEPFYSLTGLGRSIADQISQTLDYDRDTLKSIINQATVQLVEAEKRTKEAKSSDEWQEHVTVPIRDFLEGAFEKILRYQSSLDEQHEQVQSKICEVAVQAKAAEAIDPCIKLLDDSIQNIRQLYDVLLDSLNKAEEVALSIASQARISGEREATLAADGVLRRTTQIKEWTETRLDAWSMHYQNVLRFIEDVLRVDPERHVSEKLKHTIRSFDENFSRLEFCQEERTVHLNELFLEKPEERPTRAKRDSKVEVSEAALEQAGLKLAGEIQNRLDARLKTGSRVNLSSVLQEMDTANWTDLHVATGLALQKLLKDPRVVRPSLFSWTLIRGTAEIQDVEITHD
jgi:chromosome partition protein MukF